MSLVLTTHGAAWIDQIARERRTASEDVDKAALELTAAQEKLDHAVNRYRFATNAANELARLLVALGMSWEELKKLATDATRHRDEDQAHVLFGTGVPL